MSEDIRVVLDEAMRVGLPPGAAAALLLGRMRDEVDELDANEWAYGHDCEDEG